MGEYLAPEGVVAELAAWFIAAGWFSVLGEAWCTGNEYGLLETVPGPVLVPLSGPQVHIVQKLTQCGSFSIATQF